MSTSVRTERQFDSTWQLAALAGVLAGLVRPATVTVASAAGVDVGPFELARQHELPLWWGLHLVYSLAFALASDALTTGTRLRSLAVRPLTGGAVGLGYGVVLWIVNVVVVWTAVTEYLLPILATEASVIGPLFGHLVYGVVLGTLYPLLRRA